MIKNKIRPVVRSIALDMLSINAIPSKGVHLMNSHILTRKENLNSDYFDRLLGKLSKKSKIVHFGEAVELIQSRKPVNHSLIAFSFDDGFAECYSHIAPVLEQYDARGCFFIVPNFVNGDESYIKRFLRDTVHLPDYKKAMSWQEIKTLHEKGHIIGAHTMDHVRISELTDDESIHFQIGKCKKEIKSNIGISCEYFAFPYGRIERDFNEKTVMIARQYYKYIFSACDSRYYYSYNDSVFNRRHCEPFWKSKHINYFISRDMSF